MRQNSFARPAAVPCGNGAEALQRHVYSTRPRGRGEHAKNVTARAGYPHGTVAPMDKEQKERQPLKASLTKLDVAGRQINTAIELLFHGGDAISIHTLAMAAFRILYDMSKRKNRTFHFLFDDM